MINNHFHILSLCICVCIMAYIIVLAVLSSFSHYSIPNDIQKTIIIITACSPELHNHYDNIIAASLALVQDGTPCWYHKG